MKKVLVSLICMGLLTGSMASALMGPRRLAQCIVGPRKNNCSEQERKEAKGWIAVASTAAIIGALAIIGITVGPKKVQELKEEQATRADITARMEGVAQDLRQLQAKPGKQIADYEKIDEHLREISRLNNLRDAVGN